MTTNGNGNRALVLWIAGIALALGAVIYRNLDAKADSPTVVDASQDTEIARLGRDRDYIKQDIAEMKADIRMMQSDLSEIRRLLEARVRR